MTSTLTAALEQRYGGLALQPQVNLSCGGAAELVDAMQGEVCVDLGCGRGRDVMKLAEKVGPQGHVFGLDASPSMVDAARERARELGLRHVTIRESSLEALALGDASVDWVVSNCALNHARDKARVWKEIHRVLKPGGRFVVSDIFAVEPIAAQFRDDPVAVAECWAGAETKPEYLAHVAEAGLVDVTVASEKAPYRKKEALLSSFTLSGRKPARGA
ncbi:MAG: methyltransferase domain-containing protein [Myxococcota bacterium]